MFHNKLGRAIQLAAAIILVITSVAFADGPASTCPEVQSVEDTYSRAILDQLPKELKEELAKMPDIRLRSAIADVLQSRENRASVGGRSDALQLRAMIGGYPGFVKVIGKTAYFAAGNSVSAVDVTDSAHPRFMWKTLFPYTVWGVDADGRYLYVVDGMGMTVVDVWSTNTPSNPVAVGYYWDDSFAHDVYVSYDGYACVANGNGMVLLDITDPRNPTRIAFFDSVGWTTRVAVARNRAYLAVGNGGLYIIDVSNPRTPTQMSYLETWESWIYDVAVIGDEAYLAWERGVLAVDVSNPYSPTVVGNCGNAGGSSKQIATSGDYLYVANGWGLLIMSLRDPWHPSVAGGLETEGLATSLAVEDAAVAFLGDARGMLILDVSNPKSIPSKGLFQSPGYPETIKVTGDGTAFIGDLYSGLHIYDVRDPQNPFGASFWMVPGGVDGVDAEDGYAYLAGDGDLGILNVSERSHPRSAGSYYTTGHTSDVVVEENVAYLANGRCGDGGLEILNVCNPSWPKRLGRLDTPGSAQSLAVDGRGFTYVADGDMGMRIIKVKDLYNPTEVAFATTSDWVYRIAVGQGQDSRWYAYVAAGDEGLRIIDVTNPYMPVQVGSYSAAAIRARAIAIYGPYAYVGGDRGITVLDISNPGLPRELAYYLTNNSVDDIEVNLGYVYAAGDCGVLILEHIRVPQPDYKQLFLPSVGK